MILQPIWQQERQLPILIIFCLFDLNAELRTFSPPFRSPLRNAWAAWPAFAASKNARPAPVSIKFTENVFLRLERRAFLRLATIGVTPEWGGRRGSRPTHIWVAT